MLQVQWKRSQRWRAAVAAVFKTQQQQTSHIYAMREGQTREGGTVMSSDEDEYELDHAMQADGSCYSCYYWDEKHERFWRRGVG